MWITETHVAMGSVSFFHNVITHKVHIIAIDLKAYTFEEQKYSETQLLLSVPCVEECGQDEFKCPNDQTGQCMSISYLCDSISDCSSGFDEQNCSTSEKCIICH